jgi:hypothetical protein
MEYWSNLLSNGAQREEVALGFFASEEHQLNLTGIMAEGVDYLVV